MMLLGVKTYVTFLWVLLAVESMNVSTPETSSSHIMNRQPTAAHVPHNDKEVTTWNPDYDDDVTKNVELTVETKSTVIFSPATAAAAATSSSRLLHASTAVTTAAEGDAHVHSTTITKTVKPTEEQSAATSTHTSASATTSATAALSSPQPTSIANPEITSVRSTDTSSDKSVQNLSSTPASPKTTISPASESTPGFNPTSLTTGSETSTELRSAAPTISATTTLISTSEPADTTSSISTGPPNSTVANYTSTARVLISRQPKTSPPATTTPPLSTTAQPFSTDPPNTTVANYTSTAGVLIPRQPKTSPPATTTPPPSTTAKLCDLPKGPPKSEVQPCSTRGVIKPCLIAIAALAGLATIFMVSTIVLCTKLSARKYKVKKPQQATEMMCISSLLPDTTTTSTRQRQRSYVPNGVLVFPGGADSDEDGGDNLTLSSFLPENDRYV